MEVPTIFRPALAYFRNCLLTLAFIATSILLVSCGGGTTITQEGSGVTGDRDFGLTAPSNVITGQSESLSVYVFSLPDGPDGRKVAAQGVSVTFEIYDNQSGGTRDPSNAVTGSDGRAATTYTAGPKIGATDIVRVTVAGVADPQDANITVDPPGGGSLVVAVSASPDTIAAVTDVGANNQATITATVTSGTGGAIADQSVTFTTTAGTLLGCGTPCVATTNTGGVASVTLQSSTNLETADVQAQVDIASGSTTVAFIAGPAVGFALSASPPNLTADDNSTSTVTTVVRDSAAHLVADGTTVNFSLKAASIGAGDFVEIPSSDQTTGGVASVTFRAGGDATINGGNVDIRASSGGANSDDADSTYGDGLITLISERVGSVTLTIDSTTLTANGTDFTVATATVLNTGGTPVNPGTPVTFTTTSGDLDTDFNFPAPIEKTITTETIGDLGEVSVFLRSSTDPGQYFVTASSGSKSAAAQVTFEALPTDVDNSYLTVTPGTIAKGGETAVITLTARDSFSNPVSAGRPVGFTVSSGGGVISGETPTDGTGVATATITSSETEGTYDLSATIDGVTINTIEDHVTPTQITYGPGIGLDPNTVELDLSDSYLKLEAPSGSDFIKITATVTAVNGELLVNGCGANIDFSIALGPADAMLDGSTATVTKTTIDGVASVLLSAGTTPGTARVQVDVTKDSDCVDLLAPVTTLSTPITIASGPAENLFIYPHLGENSIIDNRDGSYSMLINALVTDKYGNPVEDGTAVFFDYAVVPVFGEETICPEVYTGDTPASACVTTTTPTPTPIRGVARSLLTWPAISIFNGYTIQAETLGGTVSNTYGSTYPAIAEVTVAVDVTPESVASNVAATGTVSVTYEDGASTPIANRGFVFYSDNPQVTVADSGTCTPAYPPPPECTGLFGQLSTTFNVGCVENDTIVKITAADADAPQFSGEATLTVKGLGVPCP